MSTSQIMQPEAATLRAALSGDLAEMLGRGYLHEHAMIPLLAEDDVVWIAAGKPLDETVSDELAWTFGKPVRFVDVPAAEIQAALMSTEEETATPIIDTDVEYAESPAEGVDEIDDVRTLANQAPVIRLVNVILLEAVRARASDVHLESSREGLRVRYRIDGVLHDASQTPKQYQAAVVSRVKIMAKLDVAERRLPQDGRIRLRLSDRELDLRVSTLPALHGESVVIRILDRQSGVRTLSEIGLPTDVQEEFRRLVRIPHGILLATGPTGSGKTTTLYAGLKEIDDPGVKIVAVEDPVEYQIEGVTQISVHPAIGLSFASVLRSILRHDPDVIMVGEMRDRETAEIAIQSALTGHLVLSTLHTNDAASGVTRLLDMGIEPFLVTATVRGILAQRLVRTVCNSCAQPYEPDAAEYSELARIAPSIGMPMALRRGSGCPECSGTGYRGRTGIFEVFTITDEIRSLIINGASQEALHAMARAQGMTTLRECGLRAAYTGVTTVDEVLRVTGVL